jgi:hypothetical protein
MTKFSIYCKLDKKKTWDVTADSARRDHRKSKFGLPHRIKLSALYAFTKAEG